jgi:hypothetical protein
VLGALVEQKRFDHVTENGNDAVIANIQRRVDEEWESLNKLCAM